MKPKTFDFVLVFIVMLLSVAGCGSSKKLSGKKPNGSHYVMKIKTTGNALDSPVISDIFQMKDYPETNKGIAGAVSVPGKTITTNPDGTFEVRVAIVFLP